MMTATAGDYANLPDAFRAATGRLSASSQSARIAAAEAVAQLWQSQGEVSPVTNSRRSATPRTRPPMATQARNSVRCPTRC